jgi:AmiR/NasT family two-component response regulator
VDRLRVLIAEGRGLVAARLRAQLEGLGHHVVAVARGGREAITSAREYQPDLILINNRLPDLDGIDAARAIVSVRFVPVVLVTDYPGAALVRRAQEAGVLTQLRPGDERQLRAAIEVARARFRELELLCGQARDLGEALAARKVVEHAKESLIGRAKLSAAAAFHHLRERSLSRSTSVRRAATTIVDAEQIVSRGSSMAVSLRRLLDIVAREFVPGSGQTPATEAAGSQSDRRPTAAAAEPAPSLAPA